jgi:hypothetical protein
MPPKLVIPLANFWVTSMLTKTSFNPQTVHTRKNLNGELISVFKPEELISFKSKYLHGNNKEHVNI